MLQPKPDPMISRDLVGYGEHKVALNCPEKKSHTSP